MTDSQLLYELNRKIDFLLTPPKKKAAKTFDETVDYYYQRLLIKDSRKNLKP